MKLSLSLSKLIKAENSRPLVPNITKDMTKELFYKKKKHTWTTFCY